MKQEAVPYCCRLKTRATIELHLLKRGPRLLTGLPRQVQVVLSQEERGRGAGYTGCNVIQPVALRLANVSSHLLYLGGAFFTQELLSADHKSQLLNMVM